MKVSVISELRRCGAKINKVKHFNKRSFIELAIPPSQDFIADRSISMTECINGERISSCVMRLNNCVVYWRT